MQKPSLAKNWRSSRLTLRVILLRIATRLSGISVRASKRCRKQTTSLGIYDEDQSYRGCIIENRTAKSYGIPSYIVNISFIAPDVIEQKRIDKRVANLEIY